MVKIKFSTWISAFAGMTADYTKIMTNYVIIMAAFFFFLTPQSLHAHEEITDKIFQLSAKAIDTQTIQLHWKIEDDAYLYRKFITATPVNVSSDPHSNQSIHFNTLLFPQGKIKHTTLFGDMMIYHQSLDVSVPIVNPSNQATIQLKVTYQGCSDKGQCYPPVEKIISVELPIPNTTTVTSSRDTIIPAKAGIQVKNTQELNQALQTALHEHKPVMIEFYADWCNDCTELDTHVFSQLDIQNALKSIFWIKVNMSEDTPEIWDLEEQYSIAGPPAFLFYNAQGKSLKPLNFIGPKTHDEFLKILQQTHHAEF